ncbi:MAG: AMP-binding protein [Thermoguttaceae bacterium]|nr:AMP-binding protein [Thermoguttaceae bacterium]MDW8037152.1 AMP-binding protein [Thermoguttaceae bacterium]
MRRFLTSLFWWICWVLSKIRYRVRLVGAEKLLGLQGPVLVMPNHPGNIDPPMLLAYLRLPGGLRPTVYSGAWQMPLLRPFLWLVHAIEVPEIVQPSREAYHQVHQVLDQIAEAIRRGENILLYPSGRIQRRGIEEIGANRAAAELLQRCPNVNVVLVRTRGLWGSMFTYAATGQAPRLGWCALKGIFWGLANLLFFTPRREVTITIEVLRPEQLPGLSRHQLNAFLEAWYNQDGPEKPTYVPYHFLEKWFRRKEHRFPCLQEPVLVNAERIRPATREAIRRLLEERLRRPLTEEEARPEVRLDRLGLDSLDRMELTLAVEDRFGFHSDQIIETVGDLWALAEGLRSATAQTPLEVPAVWRKPPSTNEPPAVLSETILEAFWQRVHRHPDDVVLADQVAGVLTYRRLWVGAQILARRFRNLGGQVVGLMLPSSVAADVSFLALQMAGKLPAMLNWTTGPAYLAHAVKVHGIRQVITSRRLVDRLHIEVPGAEYVFLEDLRAGVSQWERLVTLLRTYLGFPQSDLPRAKPEDDAVILFTSGSESAPKAVPLSHRNLISNIRSSLDVLQAARTDVVLGILPPFHSFGLMANLLAPILAGARMVHHPDPTDATGLVRVIAAYGATIAVTTPTFLGYMLSVARPEQLRTVRLLITGAEKCPEAVFQQAEKLAPQAVVLEGYGITECSPVVAANRPDRTKRGSIGLPVKDVEVCVVDPESFQPLPPGKTGMLLVHGPSVFRGYLAYPGPEPFVELGGKRWYVTGDLVQQDEEGFLFFQGRLKRFLKAGGEMISLPALEEPLANRYPPTEQGPQVAVEGIETPNGPHIALFTSRPISLQEANAILAEAGFRGVMRIHQVIRLEKLPVLGTGKTDYKLLRAMLAEKAAND